MTATYLGNKGTRGVQLFLPNTYPVGAVPILARAARAGLSTCTSGGDSTRESGQPATAAQAEERVYGFGAVHVFEVDR
jgi:hypothetical protein